MESKVDLFLQYAIDRGLIKELPAPPRPGLEFDRMSHRWRKVGSGEGGGIKWKAGNICPHCKAKKYRISGAPGEKPFDDCKCTNINYKTDYNEK